MPFTTASRMTRLLCLCAPVGAWAQTPPPVPLPAVTVTATRTEAPAFDVPASIDRIDGADARDGRPQVNISESLGAVPGLQARDRQNYAQDVQISVRGFGARSTFGIRGVRLYVDGIPATLPDGQGQISNVDLASVASIEVLRGPFSALYGNSSGGVIQVFTEEGKGPPRVSFGVSAGSDGQRKVSAQASGSTGDFSYLASGSKFHTDGYRDHSETDRKLGNAKLGWRPDADSKLTLVVNSVDLPRAQDPLGLSRAQYQANPRGVDPSAIAFDTRKQVNQTQGGLTYERRIDPSNSVQLTAYLGHRGTEQYQSIPVATQTNPLSPGGVITLGRDYQGADARWTLKGRLMDMPASVVAGLAYDTLEEHRLGYQNFIGSTLGVKGALRRDEKNDVTSLDPYVQAAWQFTPQWSVNAGVRHSRVRFKSTDGYIVGTNGDDSGAASYSATLPVLGVMYAVTPDIHLYATAGRGFETPTLNELAYRSSGGTGLNFGLRPSRSRSLEAGVKTRAGVIGELTAALFETRTSDEIVTQTNVGGRSTYQNAGATRRQGFEIGWSKLLAENLRAQASASWTDATYRDPFGTCTVTPCATPNLVIPAGSRIPGVAKSTVYASLNWAPPKGFRAGVEARRTNRVFVNDINSDAAPAFTTAGASVGYLLPVGAWELSGFARVDNLFDKTYAGSVIVNEGNSRYFEPAPGRTWFAGVQAGLKF